MVVYTGWVIAGIALALVNVGGLYKFAPGYLKEGMSIILAAMAAIYLGPSFGGLGVVDLAQQAIALGLIILAVFCIRGDMRLLALGLFIHGSWDAFHGPMVPAIMPDWYAPMCIGYDWTAAAFLMLLDGKSKAGQPA